MDDIRRRCRNLRAHPELGPARDDLGAGIRVYPMPKRVLVAYRISDDVVVIVHVFSGGRDYEAVLRDEGAE